MFGRGQVMQESMGHCKGTKIYDKKYITFTMHTADMPFLRVFFFMAELILAISSQF